MGKLLAFYTEYQKSVPDYNNWEKEQNICPAINNMQSKHSIQKKAEAIAKPLLLLDKYEHEKAEDSEAFFQTYNIELLSVTGILSSLPIAITTLIPFLNKHSDKSTLINKAAKGLEIYKNTNVNILGKTINLPKIITTASLIGSGLFYLKGMKSSMETQLGIIRKASFDSSQKLINDSKLFAVLTPEQEQKVNKAEEFEQKNNTHIVDSIKDKIDINSPFQAVDEYRKGYKTYSDKKNNYFSGFQNNKYNELSDTEKKEAVENQILLENLLKKVEHDTLKPLRRIETISNISYSSLYTGGFLEYLVSDKLVDVLGVKNKPLQLIVKIGAPLLTYLLLNKNIADIENKAILATKYKYLKEFVKDPLGYNSENYDEKQGTFKFLKTVFNDMKEYDKFAQNELPKIEAHLEAKRQLNLSEKQLQQADKLKKDTLYAINTQRENLYNQSVGIKAFSETILQPIDLIATAIGGKIGYNLSKKCPNKKIAGLLTGLGAIIAFIPAAIIEAKLTKQQKLSEQIANMLSIKELKDINKFSSKGKSENHQNNYVKNSNYNIPEIFKDFVKNQST